MNKNRDVRIFCVQFLYHALESKNSFEIEDYTDFEQFKEENSDFLESCELVLDKKQWEVSYTFIRGIQTNRNEIQSLIETFSENWKISRIPRVDFAILLVSIFELHFYRETPPAVVINEAIEIAKLYSNVDSKQFLNGILDKIRQHPLN